MAATDLALVLEERERWILCVAAAVAEWKSPAVGILGWVPLGTLKLTPTGGALMTSPWREVTASVEPVARKPQTKVCTKLGKSIWTGLKLAFGYGSGG